jgi:adenylate cyclase
MIGIICALICWGLNDTSLLRRIEGWLSDSGFTFRGRRPSAANIVIVDLDEQSRDAIQEPLLFYSPKFAKVVTYLHDQGAAAIGLDCLLPKGDKTMEDLLPGRRGDAESMGIAVGQAGNVVLPEWLGEHKVPPEEWYTPDMPSRQPWADLGFVDLTSDDDLCLRRQEMRMRNDRGNTYPYIALALLAKARGLSLEQISSRELVLDDGPVPLEADDCLRINYVGPPGTIRRVPFRDVLTAADKTAGRVRDTHQEHSNAGAFHALYQDSLFKDAIVLVGSTIGTYHDRYATPYTHLSVLEWFWPNESQWVAAQMAGVEFHANVLATLMDRAFITTPWFLATPLMLVIVGAALGAVLVRCSLEVGALVTIAHHLAWRGLALGAFCLADWRVEMASMLLMGLLLYGTVFAARWRWIRRMMGMVKSEAVARALEAGGAKLDLRGEQRELTVLFCDIRNFTPFSECHSPHEVVRLLNAFFTVVVPAIEAEGGVLNQYVGDAMMVLFGAPRTQPDHALRAVRAAIDMLNRVHALADRWKELGAPDFRIGVGIHTGKAVVGTVGSPRRLDYTAIGDTVNTASRIESANKELHTEVLISQATFLALPEQDRQRLPLSPEPMTLTVKGKQETLQVYAIVSGEA